MKTRGDEIAERLESEIRGGSIVSWEQLWAFLREKQGLGDDELASLDQVLRERARQLRFPAVTKLEIFLTEQCPLRCDYCFVTGKDTYSTMNRDTAFQAVDFLMRESRDEKDVGILFFGGEPLSVFPLIRDIILYAETECAARGKTCDFSMTTNGILFTEEILAFCREHKLRYLLSIDGAGPSHDRHYPVPQ
jgi:sulfatase maturation enzyme AslB (radical SAM superfamily)